MAKAKTPAVCPITRQQFRDDQQKCQPIAVKIASELPLVKKEFASGSFGYHASGKVSVQIDGVPVKGQASIQLVVVHSKEAKAGTPDLDAALADVTKTDD